MRVLNLLARLAERHEVALVAFGERRDLDNVHVLRAGVEHCSSVRVVPYRGFRSKSATALLGFFSTQPRSVVDTHSDEMAQAVLNEFMKQKCDLIVASEVDMAPYALALRGAPALLEDLELSTYLDATRRPGPIHRRLRSRLTWLKLGAYLRRTLPRFAACTVVSEAERDYVRMAAPDFPNVAVIPNSVDLSHYRDDFGPPRPNTLVFSGALTYGANYDAIRHLLADAYPAIRRNAPDVVLRITGNNDGVDLDSLPSWPGVQYTGYVPDIRPVVAQSWVSVVPLRLGGGTRLKILESMALGTPVVSTAKGAEGLDVTDGENILIADRPEQFARKVVDVLRSPELRCRLAAGGRALVEANYGWRATGDRFCALVERLAA